MHDPRDIDLSSIKTLRKGKKTMVVNSRVDIRLIAGLFNWLDKRGMLPHGNTSEAVNLLLECMGQALDINLPDTVVDALEWLNKKGYSLKQYNAGDSRQMAKALLSASSAEATAKLIRSKDLPADLSEMAQELEQLREEKGL